MKTKFLTCAIAFLSFIPAKIFALMSYDFPFETADLIEQGLITEDDYNVLSQIPFLTESVVSKNIYLLPQVSKQSTAELIINEEGIKDIYAVKERLHFLYKNYLFPNSESFDQNNDGIPENPPAIPLNASIVKQYVEEIQSILKKNDIEIKEADYDSFIKNGPYYSVRLQEKRFVELHLHFKMLNSSQIPEVQKYQKASPELSIKNLQVKTVHINKDVYDDLYFHQPNYAVYDATKNELLVKIDVKFSGYEGLKRFNSPIPVQFLIEAEVEGFDSNFNFLNSTCIQHESGLKYSICHHVD